jgi:hypothetical protein
MMKIITIGILASLLLSAALSANDSGTAQLITSFEKPTECISAIHVNKIDGREVLVQQLGTTIAAGKHTVSGRAIINTTFCAAVGRGTNRDKVEPIEAEFEAGKTYYLGYDHSSPHRKDWKFVIWKVEDSKGS